MYARSSSNTFATSHQLPSTTSNRAEKSVFDGFMWSKNSRRFHIISHVVVLVLMLTYK